MKLKGKIILFFIIVLIIIGAFIFFRYLFTYEQRNILQRQIETITGQNLRITIFDVNGKVIKQWHNVKKITSGKEHRNYVYFYTKDNKYVQIPNSVWYVAEEE